MAGLHLQIAVPFLSGTIRPEPLAASRAERIAAASAGGSGDPAAHRRTAAEPGIRVHLAEAGGTTTGAAAGHAGAIEIRCGGDRRQRCAQQGGMAAEAETHTAQPTDRPADALRPAEPGPGPPAAQPARRRPPRHRQGSGLWWSGPCGAAPPPGWRRRRGDPAPAPCGRTGASPGRRSPRPPDGPPCRAPSHSRRTPPAAPAHHPGSGPPAGRFPPAAQACGSHCSGRGDRDRHPAGSVPQPAGDGAGAAAEAMAAGAQRHCAVARVAETDQTGT